MLGASLGLRQILGLVLLWSQWGNTRGQDIMALDEAAAYHGGASVANQLSPSTQQLTFDATSLGSGRVFYDQEELLLQLGDQQQVKTFTKALGNSTTNQHFVGETSSGDSFQLMRYISPTTGREILIGSLVDLDSKLVYQFRQSASPHERAEDGKVFLTAFVTPSDQVRDSAEPYPLDSKTLAALEDQHQQADEKFYANPMNLISFATNSTYANNTITREEDEDVNVVTLMIVWSHAAECRYSNLTSDCQVTAETEDNIRSLIVAAVAETNAAYTLSSVNIQHELVHAYRHPTYVETEVVDDFDTGTFFSTLAGLLFPLDGFLDDVQQERRKHQADMVSMVIADRAYCGVASKGTGFFPIPSASFMYSVVAYDCLSGTYALAHELGHNFGCSHDRGTDGRCGFWWMYNAHGWRDPDNHFRTIMAYRCRAGQCDNNTGMPCPVVPRFSDRTVPYSNGAPLGDGRNDCSQHLRRVGRRVSRFYGKEGFLCFASHMRVQVEDSREFVQMKDLRIGDRVLTAASSNGSLTYQTIYSINHFHRTRPTEFLQLHLKHWDGLATTTNPWVLELSANHMVFVKGYDNPIAASEIQVGDYVQVLPTAVQHQQNGTALSGNHTDVASSRFFAVVMNAKNVVRHGFYNPLTLDGTIVVNGVVASAYSSLLPVRSRKDVDSFLGLDKEYIRMGRWKILSQHDFLHWMLSPYRAFCWIGLQTGAYRDEPSEDTNGYLSAYSSWGIRFGNWWQDQAESVQVFVLVVLLLSFGVIHPFIAAPTHALCTLIVLLVAFRAGRSRSCNTHKSSLQKVKGG